MNKLKKFWNYFTTYEKIWYFSVVIALVLTMVFAFDAVLELNPEDKYYVLLAIASVTSILSGVTCELLIAKQSRWNFIISLVFVQTADFVVYMLIGMWSMAVVSLVFWGIVSTISFINWSKHKDDEQAELTKVRKFTLKQDILLALAIIAFTLVGGLLLNLIPSEESSYLDACLTALAMTNGILILYRFREQWVVWFLYNLIDAIIWIVTGQYIMLIKSVAMLINSAYGMIKWAIYIRTHKQETQKLSFIDKVEEENKTTKAE